MQEAPITAEILQLSFRRWGIRTVTVQAQYAAPLTTFCAVWWLAGKSLKTCRDFTCFVRPVARQLDAFTYRICKKLAKV